MACLITGRFESKIKNFIDPLYAHELKNEK